MLFHGMHATHRATTGERGSAVGCVLMFGSLGTGLISSPRPVPQLRGSASAAYLPARPPITHHGIVSRASGSM
jgi:hypothetical protein